LARFENPTTLGAFKIQCSKFGSLMNFYGNFLLVNSLHLIIGNVEPNTIKLGESVSVSIYTSNAYSQSVVDRGVKQRGHLPTQSP